MVRVVRLRHHVGNGELQLVRPQAVGFADARKTKARPEVQQDGRGLPDDDVAIDQERRREGWPHDLRVVEPVAQCGFAAALRFGQPRHVDIVCAGRLEREPHEFPAALDRGPVVELISSGHPAMVSGSARPRNRPLLAPHSPSASSTARRFATVRATASTSGPIKVFSTTTERTSRTPMNRNHVST